MKVDGLNAIINKILAYGPSKKAQAAPKPARKSAKKRRKRKSTP